MNKHVYLLIFVDEEGDNEMVQVFTDSRDAEERAMHLNQFLTDSGAEYIVVPEELS